MADRARTMAMNAIGKNEGPAETRPRLLSPMAGIAKGAQNQPAAARLKNRLFSRFENGLQK